MHPTSSGPFFGNTAPNVRIICGFMDFPFYFTAFYQKPTISTNFCPSGILLCEYYKKVGKSLIFGLILRKLWLTIGIERIWAPRSAVIAFEVMKNAEHCAGGA